MNHHKISWSFKKAPDIPQAVEWTCSACAWKLVTSGYVLGADDCRSREAHDVWMFKTLWENFV